MNNDRVHDRTRSHFSVDIDRVHGMISFVYQVHSAIDVSAACLSLGSDSKTKAKHLHPSSDIATAEILANAETQNYYVNSMTGL